MTRSRMLAVAVLAPLVVTALAVVIGAVLIGDLQRTLAIHWDAAGATNGVAPGWLLLLGLGSLGVAIPLLVGVLLVGARESAVGVRTKVLAVVPLFVAGVLGGSLIWMAATQPATGGSDPEVWAGLLSGYLPGFALAVTGWFALPRAEGPRAPGDAVAAPSIALEADERAVWIARIGFTRSALVATGLVILVVLAGMVAAVVGTGGALWGLLAVPALLVVIFAATAAWTVRVDRDGLTVRSVLGVPRFHVRPGEVVAVGVTTVSPLAQYGGWGVRVASGRRLAVVTRPGEALEVTVGGGRRFVVTVDDAATAAGLLESYTAHQRVE